MITKHNTPLLTVPLNVKVFKTRTSTDWLDESGIVFSISTGHQTLEDAKENIAMFSECCEGKTRPLLLDFSSVKSQTREARAYYSSSEGERIVASALAIITNSVIGNLIGNFFTGLNKAPIPVRLFTKADEAKQWLLTFVEKQD